MTEHHVINPLSIGVDYPTLAARFRPIFQRIADGAVQRELNRTLPHEPLENYRALSNEQLAQKHRQYAGEVAQGRRTVEALQSNKDSHNNVDQGWTPELAQKRQADRVAAAGNELWRDSGHLGAIRSVYQERGLQPCRVWSKPIDCSSGGGRQIEPLHQALVFQSP